MVDNGRRAGAAKARAAKAAKNRGASVTSISTALAAKGEKAPPLSRDEIDRLHPTVIGLYRGLSESDEAAHFRLTDWFAVKIVLTLVTAHLNDVEDHLAAIEDESEPIGYRIVARPGHVRVGVLAEVAKALQDIHATPAGRTNYALALAALAKATAAEDEPDADESRKRDAKAATAALLARVQQGAAENSA